MSLAVIAFLLYLIYTFIGATVLTVVDDHGALLRAHDAQPMGDRMLFWMAWPLVVVRHHIRTCSR
jgi:hypothetical protein